MKTVLKYVAEDGRMFDSEKEAKEYEQFIAFRGEFIPYYMNERHEAGIGGDLETAKVVAEIIYRCPFLLYISAPERAQT